MEDKVAIIDLGTNTFHLLIAGWKNNGYEIERRERLPVKIGMGGINAGYITEEATRRAVAGMGELKKMLVESGVKKVLAFGTSAIRNARNGQEVTELLKKETGIEISVISGDQEAEYIYKGVRWAAPLGSAPALIVDIGGGSVECIIGNDAEIFWKQSFETGAQRLLEKFQKHDPILPEEVTALETYLDAELQSLWKALQRYNPGALVGSSGTFDTLSDIHCIRQKIQITGTPETPLTFTGFYEVHDELLSKNRDQRMQIPGMIEMRVDMIVVACCLIRLILSRHPFRQIRVSAYSLKEGVLASLYPG